MDVPVDYKRPLPLLPVTSVVYRPGLNLVFEVPPRDFYDSLFSYADSETNSQVALVYPVDEECSETGELSPVATIIQMTYKGPIVREGVVTGFMVAACDGVLARFMGDAESPGEFRLGHLAELRVREKALSEHERQAAVLPLWLCARLLAGRVDCWQSILPSFANPYFYQYSQDLDSLIDFIYMCLPLSYRKRVAFLEAVSIRSKLRLLREYMLQARADGFHSEVVGMTYTSLCKLNGTYLVNPS